MPRIENGENPQTGLRGLDGVKAAKLEEINESFAEAEKAGYLMSSLGFEVDATDRANRDVDGLIKSLSATGEAQTMFCDHRNIKQQVTLEQLKTIQLEIITYGQGLYAKKWLLRETVQAAATVDEVSAVTWGE
jgi:hypothetical protein